MVSEPGQQGVGRSVASGRQASDAIVILMSTAIGRCSLAYVKQVDSECSSCVQ